MKKTLVYTSAVALLGFSGLALAQGPGKERGSRGEDFKKQMLEKYDTDKDGKLSDEEKKAASAGFKAEMLEKFDLDKDGKLSDEEKKAARAANKGNRKGGRKGGPEGKKGGPRGERGGDKRNEGRRKEMLEKYDTDKDGKLSDSEKEALKADMKERFEKMKERKEAK